MIYNMNSLNTPCYIINKKVFYKNVNCLAEAFKLHWGPNLRLGYSIKTNHYSWFLKEAQEMNFMAEAVSGDELELAINEGFDPQNIILNGPQKREKDIELILRSGGILNVDNFNDINIIKKLANLNQKGLTGKVGLRVNFDLEKICDGETTAGKEVSRFGLSLENGDIKNAIEMLKEVEVPIAGLHLHFSTKTRSRKIFSTLAQVAVKIISEYLLDDIEYIDIGGGFFGGQKNRNYPTMQEYAESICDELKTIIDPAKVILILEPGASIVATSVEYLTKIINERNIRNTKVLTTDGSILHINPFMSSRIPHIERINDGKKRKLLPNQIIAGSTCMENDRFISLHNCPELLVNDILKITYVGAYTMAFNSCFINIPPKIYVEEENGWRLLRKPELYLAKLI